MFDDGAIYGGATEPKGLNDYSDDIGQALADFIDEGQQDLPVTMEGIAQQYGSEKYPDSTGFFTQKPVSQDDMRSGWLKSTGYMEGPAGKTYFYGPEKEKVTGLPEYMKGNGKEYAVKGVIDALGFNPLKMSPIGEAQKWVKENENMLFEEVFQGTNAHKNYLTPQEKIIWDKARAGYLKMKHTELANIQKQGTAMLRETLSRFDNDSRIRELAKDREIKEHISKYQETIGKAQLAFQKGELGADEYNKFIDMTNKRFAPIIGGKADAVKEGVEEQPSIGNKSPEEGKRLLEGAKDKKALEANIKKMLASGWTKDEIKAVAKGTKWAQ